MPAPKDFDSRKHRSELDYKELPAPPPPSPVHDEPATADYTPGKQCMNTTSEPDPHRDHTAANQPALKNSPLRQVASHVDVDTHHKHSPLDPRRRLGGFLSQKSLQHRRATLPSPAGRERSSSSSSSQGVSSKPSTSFRSTFYGMPNRSPLNHSRSTFENSPRPSIRGRQISAPIMSEQPPPSPTLYPRPETPSSTSQSRSASFSTQDTEVSYFSEDSEGEKKGKGFKLPSSGKKGSIERRNGQSGRFRRGLSTFLTCGKDWGVDAEERNDEFSDLKRGS